ncbi:MAG: aminopeptidase N [Myxococcales bacterium FL481]|nr:MAG: aminopeptidase N [Myxococcales bacterium FL481]
MDAPAPRFRRDYRPPSHLIERVDLEFDLRPQRTEVRSRLEVRPSPETDARPAPRLTLDAEALELVSVAVDGRPLSPAEYELTDTSLTLPVPAAPFVVDTVVRIDPDANKALSGLYRSNALYCTQCEAEGFRRITPYLDRPDVMATFTTRITADAQMCPALLSNGDCTERGQLDDGRHFAVWHDPAPKPSYLFALVAGQLECHADEHVTPSGRRVALEIWVEPDNIERCAHAMRSLKRAMVWDEQVFDLEYDLSTYMIVAVSDFNMGAMENKGLNIFNAKFVLAERETATDEDCEGIESVVAHEYFHNWTGNRVTCRDWFQLTLKEGLTVFRDQWFTSEVRSAGVKRIHDVKRLRTHQFVEDAGPMRHPIRPESYIEMNNFYTPTVYSKGAEVIRMLRTLLGRDGFLAGMRLYFERHDGQAVTCDDFLAAMADANGADLTQFARWYARAGTPIVVAHGHHDPDRHTYDLQLEQRHYNGDPVADDDGLHIPVAVGLLGPDGSDLPLRLDPPLEAATPEATTQVLHLRSPRQSFRFVGVRDAPVLSLLRDFSAPVRVEYERSREELALLLRRDHDPFNRWDAGVELATQALLELTAAFASGNPPRLCTALTEGVADLLRDQSTDESWLALALTLPEEGVVAQSMRVVDVENLHAAARFAARTLGGRFIDQWRSIYEARRHDEYRDDAAAIGRRALKNVALAYLVATEATEAVDLALEQFRQASNMSDALAALACLADVDGPQSRAALSEFYDRWRGVPLVVDKWFAVQAAARRADVVERVDALRRHADFHLSNPNRVRSLVATFCQLNQAGFHRRDGAGYELLTDTILAVDANNPQLAARLAAPLTQAHRHDESRQDLQRAALRQLVERPTVSRDVYEIAARSLGLVDSASA